MDQSIQRVFFAVAAGLNYNVHGGDAQDACAHSPPPAVPTFVAMDDAHAEWHEACFGIKLDKSMVLPVQHALQGHPESGRSWGKTH